MSGPEQTYKISNFIQDIVSKNIVQFNKTELSCGRTSSYYADFRQLLAHPDLTNYVVSQLIKIIETIQATGETVDTIAGVAVAGVPWATLVGNKLNKPVSIIRLNEKTHGKKSAIDGAPIKFEDRVILIEDVLTTGGSVLNAIRKIANTGAEIVRVISLLDRNEGAAEHIKYYFPDIKISSILSIDTLVSVCSANKLIPDYVAEQIEFYRETGYTETIKMLTKLNEDAKEKDFQKDPVAWHNANYSDIWNLTPTNESTITTIESGLNNALFVDISDMHDWQEIKYKINAIGNRLRNLVIMFEKIKGWNESKQQDLIDMQHKYGFNVVYKSHEIIPQTLVINTTPYTIYNNLGLIMPNCKYPNSVLVNGIILNLYIDNNYQSTSIINQLRDTIKKYEVDISFNALHISNIFINLVGPGASNTISDREIWSEFTNYILGIMNNQALQIKGVILPYVPLKSKSDIFIRYKDLSRLIPLILDVSNPFDFHLEPSMLTDKPNSDYIESLYTITKVFNGNGFTHLMVGGDLMQSNIAIETKIEQYVKFMIMLSANQKKAFGIKEICEKKGSSSANTKDNIPFTKLKVEKYNQKSVLEVAKPAIIPKPMTTQHNGVYDKVKGYLFNTTNGLLGLFGLSLTTK